MTKRWYIALVILFTALTAHAQPGGGLRETMKALVFTNEGQLDSAQHYIEKAVASERGKTDPQSWMIRGYVYKAIYKEREKSDKSSPARVKSLDSYYTALNLKAEGEVLQNTTQGIRYLANSYYNDAVTSLNVRDYEISLKNYEDYKVSMLKIEPEQSFVEQDVQYYNVLGSTVYSILADREPDHKKKNKYIQKALDAYRLVLDMDKRNFSANYNIAVLYYNQGVNKIKEIDPLAPFDTVILRQDQSVELFQKAKPFMLLANRIDGSKREVYIGLSGIYFSLNEVDSSNYYSKQLEQLDENSGDPNRARLENFNAAYSDVALWVQANSRVPKSDSENLNEKQYGLWLDDMRVDHKAGRLLPEMIEKLEALPGWEW